MGEGYGVYAKRAREGLRALGSARSVSIFNEDLQDVTRSLQRLHQRVDPLEARQNLVSARRLILLFGFLVHILHVQGKTDAHKANMEDVRGEHEDIGD